MIWRPYILQRYWGKVVCTVGFTAHEGVGEFRNKLGLHPVSPWYIEPAQHGSLTYIDLKEPIFNQLVNSHWAWSDLFVFQYLSLGLRRGTRTYDLRSRTPRCSTGHSISLWLTSGRFDWVDHGLFAMVRRTCYQLARIRLIRVSIGLSVCRVVMSFGLFGV